MIEEDVLRVRGMERQKVMELCRDLGHAPSSVSRIIIEPDHITVEYFHPIYGTPEAAAANAKEFIDQFVDKEQK